MDTAKVVGCAMVASKINNWLDSKILKKFAVDNVYDITMPMCHKLLKDELADRLTQSVIFVTDLNQYLVDVQQLKDENDALKSKLIDAQEKVVGLQAELLSSRSEQLDTLQETVKTSVEDTVKAEFVSYSAAVVQSQKSVCPMEPKILESVVQQVVEDTDRSRSLMVFGFPEQDDEKICDHVSSVFEAIGEKPRFEACRLGKKKSSDTD